MQENKKHRILGKNTTELTPAYEHTVFGRGTEEQKTTRKNTYKLYIGL
jgi:hypothetical protein